MNLIKFRICCLAYFVFWGMNLCAEDQNLSAPFLWQLESKTIAKDPEVTLIAAENTPEEVLASPQEIEKAAEEPLKESEIVINFNNIDIVELLKFISRISGKNFIFNQEDLQFKVTIISEEPTSIENVLTAVFQELRVHGLTILEQGNSLVLHKSDGVRGLSEIEVAGVAETETGAAVITRVFRISALDPAKAASLIRPFVSDQGLVDVSELTKHVIVTDLRRNVDKIAELIESLDFPNTGLVIGQYAIKNSVIENLVEIVTQLMAPLATGQELKIIPYKASNSVFVVANAHLVERAITLLKRLDEQSSLTEVIDLESKQLELQKKVLEQAGESKEQKGRWEFDDKGGRVFVPGGENSQERPQGRWFLDPEGNWYFAKEGTRLSFDPGITEGEPKGTWELSKKGNWIFKLDPDEQIQPKRLERRLQKFEDLPEGHIERTQFYIHKLDYRKGDQIVDALQQMAFSLRESRVNFDLVSAIDSVQWIEATNALIITGTAKSIMKLQELIEKIDVPLRQVFIEILLLETTIEDSLKYKVESGTRSGGGNTATSQAFLGSTSILPGALDTTGVTATPNANSLARTVGYALGIIGQRITHNGVQYASLGALVHAVHTKNGTNVVLNPKLLAEDNTTAEIFVGLNIPFQTDSISNDVGSVITNNFEYRDVGTTLRVTPFIGNNNVITLEIEQEVSRVVPSDPATRAAGAGPTTSINRTITKVHIPDESFLVLSGMLFDEQIRLLNQVPCLGGVPLIGAAFKDQEKDFNKRNTMMFVRPKIIDTEIEGDVLTKRQQNIYKSKAHFQPAWKEEVDMGLDFLNIKEDCCQGCDAYPPTFN
jgi:type III secretion protein C